MSFVISSTLSCGANPVACIGELLVPVVSPCEELGHGEPVQDAALAAVFCSELYMVYSLIQRSGVSVSKCTCNHDRLTCNLVSRVKYLFFCGLDLAYLSKLKVNITFGFSFKPLETCVMWGYRDAYVGCLPGIHSSLCNSTQLLLEEVPPKQHTASFWRQYPPLLHSSCAFLGGGGGGELSSSHFPEQVITGLSKFA